MNASATDALWRRSYATTALGKFFAALRRETRERSCRTKCRPASTLTKWAQMGAERVAMSRHPTVFAVFVLGFERCRPAFEAPRARRRVTVSHRSGERPRCSAACLHYREGF